MLYFIDEKEYKEKEFWSKLKSQVYSVYTDLSIADTWKMYMTLKNELKEKGVLECESLFEIREKKRRK